MLVLQNVLSAMGWLQRGIIFNLDLREQLENTQSSFLLHSASEQHQVMCENSNRPFFAHLSHLEPALCTWRIRSRMWTFLLETGWFQSGSVAKKKLPPIRRERNGILAPLKRRAWYAQRRSCIKCCHIACHATKLLLTCVCIVRESNMRTAPKVRTPYLAGAAKQFWISLRLGWGEQRFWCTRHIISGSSRACTSHVSWNHTSSRELNLRFINFQPFL